MIQENLQLDVVKNNGHDKTVFDQQLIHLEGDIHRLLSGQMDAVNFRLRTSPAGYLSDWHVAGDPTLLVILAGQVKIELRSGESKVFGTGDMFVAEDFLTEDTQFSETDHGHRAEVIGTDALKALHLKLAYRNNE